MSGSGYIRTWAVISLAFRNAEEFSSSTISKVYKWMDQAAARKPGKRNVGASPLALRANDFLEQLRGS